MTTPLKSSPLIIVSGASGSGKTTLCRLVAEKYGFYYGVSHTTRPKRASEREGEDYYFVSKSKFKEMIDKNDFLEWATVYGNLYGTSKSVVQTRLKQGQGVILDVDTQGAARIKKICPKAHLIFILCPSKEILEERLLKRGTDSKEALSKRLQQVEKEESHQSEYDHILVNEELDKVLSDLEKIIDPMV